MEITKVIATNLRYLRESQGLSRDALAKMAEVSSQTVYDIENENRKPSIMVMETLARKLGVEVAALLKGEERPKIRELPVSETLKKMMAIPDNIYDLAVKVDINDSAWTTVRIALEIAIDRENIMNAEKRG